MQRLRRNAIPAHPNVKPIGLGVDMIRSMATSHSDPIAAILELIDNVHDMHKQKKATSVNLSQIFNSKKLIIN